MSEDADGPSNSDMRCSKQEAQVYTVYISHPEQELIFQTCQPTATHFTSTNVPPDLQAMKILSVISAVSNISYSSYTRAITYKYLGTKYQKQL